MTPCTALVLSMTRIILTPLYNSLPLSLHPHIVYFIYLIPPVIIYWRLTSRSSPRELVSARVCLGITALAADLVAVGGRRTGSLLAHYCGAQWGALLSQGILGVGVVGGGMCFALLCFVCLIFHAHGMELMRRTIFGRYRLLNNGVVTL
jgi:hypothetical protein